VINFRVQNKIKIPKDFDFSNELKDISENVVIPLLEEGIATNTSIKGGQFPPLEYSTAKRKFKKRGHIRPLIDTGTLANSFSSRKTGKNKVTVFINGSRKTIGWILQMEGVGYKKKKFEFFGLTEGMEKDSMEIMKKKLGEMLSGQGSDVSRS